MVSALSDEQQPFLRASSPRAGTLDERFNEHHFLGKLLATSFNYFVSGVAVTALGALIPGIEATYDVPDGTVAAIFPCTTGGYLCSTASIQFVHVHLGRRGLGCVSSFSRVLAFAALIVRPQFPLVLLAFCLLGFGTGLTDSGWAAWASGLRFPNIVQGPLHGSFGVGCILGPILAVSMINSGHSWNTVYGLLLVFGACELLIQLWAFWHSTSQEYRESVRAQKDDAEQNSQVNTAGDENVRSDYLASNPFRHRGTWLCAAFFFVYVSIEFTYSDWIVTYMSRARHTPYSTAGLSSSTFWLGMSVGRLCLGPVTERFGVKPSVTVYVVLSFCFQIIFKEVEHTATAFCILVANGFMLAPTFPSGLVLLTKSVPSHAQVGAVAAACAIGQIGGASVPYLIGFMAEQIGIHRLLDVILVLTAVLIMIWSVYCRLCRIEPE